MNDPILIWTVRHSRCGRFVRMARLRDLWATLLDRPMYEDGPCETCEGLTVAPATAGAR